MGFLNHATNNIIVDAVLTEKGREILARNDGSFAIQSFRLGDDEVDYSILEQYGIVIGKEKIEKNTPIFEAITAQNLALKYPLRSFLTNNTEDIFAIPYLVLGENITTPVSLSSNLSSKKDVRKSITVKTFVDQDQDFVLSEDSLKDTSFTVKVFDKLIKLTGASSRAVKNDIAYYKIGAQVLDEDFQGQQVCSFTVTAQNVVNASTFKFFSTKSNNSLIKTQIEIIGNNTNSSIIIPVTIQNNIIT
tara:strand:- start:909 stop:1649 length:741 start_codon:yes stop_codon:yes gene_type:complete